MLVASGSQLPKTPMDLLPIDEVFYLKSIALLFLGACLHWGFPWISYIASEDDTCRYGILLEVDEL